MLAKCIHNFLGIVIAHGNDDLLVRRVFSSHVNSRLRYSRIVEDQLVEIFHLLVQEFQENFLDFENIVDNF